MAVETVEGASLTPAFGQGSCWYQETLRLHTPSLKHTPKGTSLAFFSSNHSTLLCLTSFPTFPSGGEIPLIFEEAGLPVLPSETHEEGQITLAELIRDLTAFLLLPQDITHCLLFNY